MHKAAFLHMLRPLMKARGMSAPTLAETAKIAPPRLTDLLSRKYEPFLDEAVALARALGADGVLPLILSGDLTLSECDLGIPLPSDLSMLRANVKLPLSLACRIVKRLGIADPILLVQRPVDRELWEIVIKRSTGAVCPFCRAPLVGVAGHLPTCLPDTLWGARDMPHDLNTLGALPQPLRPGKGRRGSHPAHGLKREREKAGVQAQHLAEVIGKRPDYYSRIERMKLNLTLELAERIAGVLKIDPAVLYA